FLSPRAYHGIVKQPADYVVGSLKALNVQNVGSDVAAVLRRMGQDLLNPPDVGGWRGGPAWINSSTLFERFDWGDRLAMGRDATKPSFSDIADQIRSLGATSPDALVDAYLSLFVDGDITPEARQSLVDYLNTPTPLVLGDGRALD